MRGARWSERKSEGREMGKKVKKKKKEWAMGIACH